MNAWRHLPLAALLLASPAIAEKTPEGERTVNHRRLVLLSEGGIGTPEGLMSGRVGYTVAEEWAVELGGGLGFTGYKIAPMARRTWAVNWGTGDLDRESLGLGFGPAVGLLSERLGLNVPHAEGLEVDTSAIYYASWLNAELSYEFRGRRGGVVRVRGGVSVRALENMTWLCEGEEPTREYTDCYPPHFAAGPVIANAPAFPYGGFGYGFAF